MADVVFINSGQDPLVPVMEFLDSGEQAAKLWVEDDVEPDYIERLRETMASQAPDAPIYVGEVFLGAEQYVFLRTPATIVDARRLVGFFTANYDYRDGGVIEVALGDSVDRAAVDRLLRQAVRDLGLEDEMGASYREGGCLLLDGFPNPASGPTRELA